MQLDELADGAVVGGQAGAEIAGAQVEAGEAFQVAQRGPVFDDAEEHQADQAAGMDGAATAGPITGLEVEPVEVVEEVRGVGDFAGVVVFEVGGDGEVADELAAVAALEDKLGPRRRRARRRGFGAVEEGPLGVVNALATAGTGLALGHGDHIAHPLLFSYT